MKLMFFAIALTIASPALAQTAATADAHANHATQMAQTAPGDHSAHGTTSSTDPHAGHEMSAGCCEKMGDAKMPCCEKMKAASKMMDCCAKMGEGSDAVDPHAGHNMGETGAAAGDTGNE